MSDYGERTRTRIKSAFEQLVAEQPGKRLTVAGILNLSGVSRSTFYVYYENLEDLIEDLASDFAADVIRLIRNNRSTGSGVDSYREAYEIFVQFVAQHKAAYAVLLKTPRLEKLLTGGIREYLYEQYCQDFPDKDPELLRYSANACTSYVYSILSMWAAEGFQKSPEELSHLLTDSIRIATDIFLA